jgi:putative transposase
MMQMLEGDFGIIYNQRKHRRGAFWGDRYHCTMVEEGEHLWNCVRYVDLNMVRAGVVLHPSGWKWCGYQELVGLKSRYRLLDINLLLELLGKPDLESFREEYQLLIQNTINQKKLRREERWTESIAVGGEEFVRRIALSIRRERLKPIIKKAEDGSWAVWESSSDYGAAPDSCLD